MIGLIFSQSSNGYIGKDGKLLFSIPEDMKRFKDITKNSIVIMGRKTWDSLPNQFKPLPERINIILTSQPSFKITTDNTFVYDSLNKAIQAARSFNRHCKIWIIGGERLFNEGILYADTIEQTLVTKEFNGDTKAPVIYPTIWKPEVGRHFKEHDGLYYQFNTYRRIKS